MIRFLALLPILLLAGCAAPEGPATHVEKPNVLPLALDDNYQFRKVLQSYVNSAIKPVQTTSEPAIFERARATWGAIDSFDIQQRNGNYYKFFWRTRDQSDVTVRFEYRQAGLGNYVMAQEREYPAAKGSYASSFEVTGDQFLENGRVTGWRALLIVDGRIVGLKQSFMWR